MTISHVSFGYDSHKFCDKKDELVLGGSRIKHRGLEGVSDADVVIHAIVDAILSGTIRKSIGEVFDEKDEKNVDRSSMDFLVYSREILRDHGMSIVNIDCTIVCDTPRVSKYSHDMCRNISGALGIREDQIFIKGKTTEGLGGIDGIICYAVVGLDKLGLDC